MSHLQYWEIVVTLLYVLGSGSRGNCFAIECDGAALLIDAGFSAKEIEKRAAKVGLDLGRLVGIAITHEHGDHASGAPRLARRHAVPLFTAPATFSAIFAEPANVAFAPLHGRSAGEVGPFVIGACRTSHDANEPQALAVHTTGGVSLGIAYDLGRATAGLRYLLRGMSALILESNYDEVLLRTSSYPPSVQQRIAGNGGHLSNRAAAELLAQVCHAELGTVVLAHLSQQCNTETAARSTVEPVLRQAGFRGTLHVARQDEPLPPITLVPGDGVQLGLGLGAGGRM